jgi:hypothetical protein
MHVLLKLDFFFPSAETRKCDEDVFYSCMHMLFKLDFLFPSAETRKCDEDVFLHACAAQVIFPLPFS